MSDVGYLDGHIAAVSEQPLEARTVIRANGLVVSPGFIDLHQHGQTEENYAFKARDGVTTALELEVGVSPIDSWYQQRNGKSLINFGASAGHIPIRMKVFGDSGTLLPRDRAVDGVAKPEQLQAILQPSRTGWMQARSESAWESHMFRALRVTKFSGSSSWRPAAKCLSSCICEALDPWNLAESMPSKRSRGCSRPLAHRFTSSTSPVRS